MTARPYAIAVTAAAERRAERDPWEPKPCPFCGDQTYITLQIDFGDVFRSTNVYAICLSGHRTRGYPYDRADPASIAAAEQTARDDWDARTEPPRAWPL